MAPAAAHVIYQILNDFNEKAENFDMAVHDMIKRCNKALEEYEKVLYMPLTSGLSGSCYTAMAMAQDEKYEGRVIVVDHGQIATPLHQMVLDTLVLIEKGYLKSYLIYHHLYL